MTNVASSLIPVQQSAVAFNNPVGVSTQIAQAAVLNAMLNILCPVGTVIPAMVTEAQFQASIGSTNWILADGRDVTGSQYETLTGSSTVVNLTGQFIRGKNDGRSDGDQNPDGNLPLGTFSADKTGAHSHVISAFQSQIQASGSARISTRFDNGIAHNTSWTTTFTGGVENSPKNITVSNFIRIN